MSKSLGRFCLSCTGVSHTSPGGGHYISIVQVVGAKGGGEEDGRSPTLENLPQDIGEIPYEEISRDCSSLLVPLDSVCHKCIHK